MGAIPRVLTKNFSSLGVSLFHLVGGKATPAPLTAPSMVGKIRSVEDLLLLLLWILMIYCFLGGGFRCQAQTLPPDEVETLRQIGSKLRMNWDFSIDPCSRTRGWVNVTGKLHRNVTCDCSYNKHSLCHVVSIELMRLNLTGVLPEEIVNLSYLRYLDLSRNYLMGSIPATWAYLPVFNLSLHGNHLSGKIPRELGSMPSLKSLQLENNLFNGSLPPELGNLHSLERLFISGNNITGGLPLTFAMLTNLTDFRIDGTSISGKIPDFIQHWSRVNRIDMQGTLMTGPIPSNISLLKNLTELRITDLHGQSMTFPLLENAEHLTELVLRNCLIYGEIPPYLGNMKYLKVLDLSFNNLSGQIPSNFINLGALEYMYLTHNKLTGEIPSWMLRNKPSSKINLDISYNDFSGTAPVDCQEGNVNMVESFSSSKDNSILPCLRKNLPCPVEPKYSSLFINCGGQKVVVDEQEYEDDSSQTGTSTFHASESGRWAYSSTGDFVANEDADYIARNMSILKMTHPELYTEARLSPLSLKYYGLCLENGNYTVSLHFSEIVFTGDQTFSSNGKRVFDVMLQGNTVLKDFNIEDVAGGPGQKIIRNFTAPITENTLEIHLYWAGKGTTAIPERGVYGPLISAISVTQSSKGSRRHTKISVGVMAGIIGASCFFIILLSLFLWVRGLCPRKCLRGNGEFRYRGRRHNTTGNQEQSQYFFSLKQIAAATRDFHPSNKIGEGGFGPVYKGVLADGTTVAVKQLSSISSQGNREFLNEIGMISALQHPNLVRLFGGCIEGNELLLIYEYMENNSLGRALFGHEEHRMKLNWPTRCMICLGIARGLAYLHEESRLRIVHRDIKPTNILLDKDLNPKISDFGLAKLYEEKDTHISTRIAGTVGYMAPEYATRGYLTHKADVYSFGVVILEVVSGMSNSNYKPEDKSFYLLDWANILVEHERLLELVDPTLGSDYSEDEALRILKVALICTNQSHASRPVMSTVVGMLLGQTPVPAPHNPNYTEEWSLIASTKHNSSQGDGETSHGLSTDTSASLRSGGGISQSRSSPSPQVTNSS